MQELGVRRFTLAVVNLFILPSDHVYTVCAICLICEYVMWATKKEACQLTRFVNYSLFSFWQDHPGLRGTPLAMLAAQCNKLSTKSPPPLADAAVGKGFHPWKKSPSSQQQPTNSSPNSSTANNLTQSSTSPEASNNTQQQPQRYQLKAHKLLAVLYQLYPTPQ